MAMKCVAQIPQPVAAPAVAIQIQRARACEAPARCGRQTAAKLARKQTSPASATRRSSCSAVKQVRTRNIVTALFGKPKKATARGVSLELPRCRDNVSKAAPDGDAPSAVASRMAGDQRHLNDPIKACES